MITSLNNFVLLRIGQYSSLLPVAHTLRHFLSLNNEDSGEKIVLKSEQHRTFKIFPCQEVDRLVKDLFKLFWLVTVFGLLL